VGHHLVASGADDEGGENEHSDEGPLYAPRGPRAPPSSPWEDTYLDKWRNSIPQQTIFKEGLPRDRWVPMPVPKNLRELQDVLKSEPVQDVLSDPQKRNYWIYQTGRSLFFFLSSFTNQVMQIRLEPKLNPVESGLQLRMELAAALKRIAMSGSRPDVVDSATRIPSMERVRRLFGSILELYRRDCKNVFYGVYRAPYDASLRHRQFSLQYVKKSFENTLGLSMETGHRRKMGKAGALEIRQKLRRRAAEQASGVVVVDDPFEDDEDRFNDYFLIGDLRQYPKYYLQNFHWQTDGWMSTSSAKAYEYTTETLFSGTQDAMQRQGFVSISEFVSLRKGIKEESEIDLLEVACGTGRLHTFIKDNWPRMRTVATDLSPYYLQEARENMDYFAEFTEQVTGREIRYPEYVQCKAEDMPFQDASFDIVTCTYLFHEIPMRVRRQVAAEMFRVLRPGGIVVITDSFQMGDQPEKDHVGALFPANYHEPFYANYFEKTDIVGIFMSQGFKFKRHQLAHLSKVLTFEKIDDRTETELMIDPKTTTLRRGGGSWAIV